MRFPITILSILAMSACTATSPDKAAGVGFDGYTDYEQQRAQRDAQLSASVNDRTPNAISDEVVTGQPLVGTTVPTTTTAPRPTQNNSGISDEQDFSAVTGRESIESDRERLRAQGDSYQVIQPTALPTRSGGSSGPSIVDYALSTSNQRGQSVYKRSGAFAQSRFDKNCAKFGSSDLAQIEFLKSGGPKSDRKGIDPDGDGFACYWDPAPFRRAVGG